MKISSILEATAAKYESGLYPEFVYSCVAVEDNCPLSNSFNDIVEGLEEMGLDTQSRTAFLGVPYEDIVKARMLWLTWAAMMAREQGL